MLQFCWSCWHRFGVGWSVRSDRCRREWVAECRQLHRSCRSEAFSAPATRKRVKGWLFVFDASQSSQSDDLLQNGKFENKKCKSNHQIKQTIL